MKRTREVAKNILKQQGPSTPHFKLKAIWVLWLISVIVGSVLPASSAPMRDLGKLGINDKFEHFFAYAALAALLPWISEIRRKRLFTFLAVLVLLGILLEFAQMFVPGRTPDPMDALADSGGVLLGAVAGWLISVSFRRQRWASASGGNGGA